jgi:hypothetical protein
VGPQPVMEPRFLGRSARSLISTSGPSISYRLEAWPLKILYCTDCAVRWPDNKFTCMYCAPPRTADSCTAISLLYRVCPCHIMDLLTSVRVLCYQSSCRGCFHLANVLKLWQPRFSAVLEASVTAWPLIPRYNHDQCGLFNDVK